MSHTSELEKIFPVLDRNQHLARHVPLASPGLPRPSSTEPSKLLPSKLNIPEWPNIDRSIFDKEDNDDAEDANETEKVVLEENLVPIVDVRTGLQMRTTQKHRLLLTFLQQHLGVPGGPWKALIGFLSTRYPNPSSQRTWLASALGALKRQATYGFKGQSLRHDH